MWLFLVGLCLSGVAIVVFLQKIFENYSVRELIIMQDMKGMEHFNEKMKELIGKKQVIALNLLLILSGVLMVSGILAELLRVWGYSWL